ncbi:MAG TPA: PEP-CTERM sorting domain-containing protein [Lacipirellulaceae bacterium]|nr:PEP-CTERM sorting domain-containing protein [Lacipirellulaceae bacterium]
MAGCFNLIRRTHASLALSAALVACAVAAPPAQAVVPVPTGFALDIASSARVLDALDMKRDGDISASQFYDIKYEEACDNPHLRIRARGKPAIMITNEDFSSAPITSFTLAIAPGAGAYIFGSGDAGDAGFLDFIKNTMYTDAGVSITGNSLSADKKTLTVNFDGLTAGKKAIFNVDLDTTDPNGFMYPDYRMVLFGAPEQGESPTDPAVAKATFTNATPAPNSITLTINFEQETETPNYYMEDIRPYRVMDGIEIHEMDTAVPEPATLALAFGGLAALAARRRKQARLGC